MQVFLVWYIKTVSVKFSPSVLVYTIILASAFDHSRQQHIISVGYVANVGE